ncbi:MAG TPA: CHAD domain-containing protein [Actinomycetota bacterium]|nr:CHAD domain-containing protein [Actinomycetota bacterium]
MREQLDAIVALEPIVRIEGSPDAIHDMRVATRRLRATISLFKSALPVRAIRFRDELRWLGSALGKVRDIDVQREGLARWIDDAAGDERQGLRGIDELMAQRRAEAYERLLRTLDMRRYAHLKESLEIFVRRARASPNPAARMPAVVVMPELIAKRYRSVRKAGRKLGRSSDAAELHALRIRCKRLRYALEIVTPLYPDPAETLVKRLVRLQDVLGEIQDAEIAIEQMQELGRNTGRRLPTAAVFALGRVAERQHERAGGLRKRFPSTFAAIEGKRWKQLKREMERRRAAGAVPIPS